jgi:tRNA pseudouridine55 synthase
MNVKKHNRIAVDGIILLDKPIGLSSNAALQQVKHLFQAKKAGHTGSLDPLASGMLPICFGEATKFSQFLLDADKHYLVAGKFGIKTSTGDTEGEVIAEKSAVNISSETINQVLPAFRGEIAQIPSMYSAIKYQGKPLYSLARQGITIERTARKITIFHLELLSLQDDIAYFDVRCSKGTYIRTLIEDIGEALGCGAHVNFLRRLSVAAYQQQQMVTMEQLQAADNLQTFLLPAQTAIEHWPSIQLSKNSSFYILRGQPIIAPNNTKLGMVQLINQEGKFIGVGEVADNGMINPKRLVTTGVRS